MTITVTSLRLKNLWGFFRLSWMGFQITLQARKQPGFRRLKNTGFGYMHFTMSAWDSAKDAKAFALSGAHLVAMKNAASVASEVRIYTFAGDSLPTWEDAKKLVLEKGHVYKYR